jgi:hypothetical protein
MHSRKAMISIRGHGELIFVFSTDIQELGFIYQKVALAVGE